MKKKTVILSLCAIVLLIVFARCAVVFLSRL